MWVAWWVEKLVVYWVVKLAVAMAVKLVVMTAGLEELHWVEQMDVGLEFLSASMMVERWAVRLVSVTVQNSAALMAGSLDKLVHALVMNLKSLESISRNFTYQCKYWTESNVQTNQPDKDRRRLRRGKERSSPRWPTSIAIDQQLQHMFQSNTRNKCWTAQPD